MVVEQLHESCQLLFPDQDTRLVCWLLENARSHERIKPNHIPLLAMLTGTQQKVDTVAAILSRDTDKLSVGSFVHYSGIEVPEKDYVSGGEIALHKLVDFFEVFWEQNGKYRRGGEPCYRKGQCFQPQVWLTSDVKVRIGPKWKSLYSKHKLRTQLGEDNIHENASLTAVLPEYLSRKYGKWLGSTDLVAKWSTGNAALRVLNLNGDRAIAWGQSEASICIPNRLVVNPRFWNAYLERGMKERDGSLKAHLGIPMGLFVEDVVRFALDPEFMKEVGIKRAQMEEFGVRLPKYPQQFSQLDYLVRHAKGAADDVVMSVLGKVAQMDKPEQICVARFEY